MNRQEKYILLGAVVAAGALGYLSFKGGVTADGATVNSSLKKGVLDLTTDDLSYDNWTCPQWSIKQVTGGNVLRLNHPLHRRPKYIGENRHKVMTEGWGGWYYNPPGDAYF